MRLGGKKYDRAGLKGRVRLLLGSDREICSTYYTIRRTFHPVV